MPYDILLEHAAAIPLAVVKLQVRQTELAQVVPAACGQVWSALKKHHVTGAGRHVALYWDDVMNLEVGVELPPPFDGADEVVPSATPAGEVAATTHLGPYAGLAAAHGAIQMWCVLNGRELAGPSWEIYGHWLPEWNRNPTLIRTDVYYLLKP